MRRTKPAILLALTVATMLFMSACTDSAVAGPATIAVDGEPVEEVTIDIQAMDTLSFSETEIEVPAGSWITLNFTNGGVLEHNLVLIDPDTDPATATEADALDGVTTGILGGGAEKSLEFAAPPPGTYTFVCTIPGHAAAGMKGTLVVTG